MTLPFVRFVTRLAATMAATIALVGVASVPARAASAASAYQHAQARERTARKSPSPTAATLRAIATNYEAIVRKYPSSGYCDNALWQAAGLLQLAYEHGDAARDREAALRMLQWLKREYPNSSYAKQVDERVATLLSRRGPVAEAAPLKPRASPAPSTSPSVAAQPSLRERPAVPPTAVAGPARPAAPPKPTTATAKTTDLSPLVKAAPLAPLPVAFREYPVSLREASYAALPRGERLTVELTQEMPHTVQRAAVGDQLTLDLPGVGVSATVIEAINKLRGTLVRTVHITPGPDGLVVKLDLAGRPRFSTFPLYDPYRIVIDLDVEETAAVDAPAPVAQAVALKSTTRPGMISPAASASSVRPPAPIPTTPDVGKPTVADAEVAPMPPASTKGGNYSLARQLGLGVSRIVIDPGHGGHDPGAQANGVSEAELTLDIAKRLEVLLHNQPGFEVVLTRGANDYVGLQERTAIANRESADLFLSIHANSSPQRETRGIETYFLNFASNPHAEAVAARENATSVQAMGVLPQILKAIALTNKVTESRELAGMVQGSLVRRLAVQNKGLKDLGVKQAPFVVLIGAQMPSVLAEISFLTNKPEAGFLKQDIYRQRIAQALCDAVLKYQSSLKKVATVAAASTTEPR